MRYLIALLGLALILPHTAAAQAYDWRPVNRDTAGMLRAGQFDAARPIIEGALANCPNAVTPVEAGLCTAIFTENLADVREHQGDLAGAEADLRKTLEVRTSVLPANDPLIGQAHFYLALYFERHGRRADEIASLQAAESIARVGGQSQRSQLALLLGRHAAALTALSKPADAVPLYQEAYDVSSEATGPTSRDTLAALGNLFDSQVAAGQSEVAIDRVSTVLASPDVGNYDPTQRALLAGLLALHTTTTPRSKAALGFVEAALPDIDAGLVDDANASFTLLWGAARLNAGVGDAKRAVDLAHRARDIAARTWGTDSHGVSNVLRTEANADAVLRDFPAGIARLNDAAAMLSSPQYGLEHVQVEVELGNMLSRAGRNAEAVEDHQAIIGSSVVTDAAPPIKAAMLVLLGEDLLRLQAYEPSAKACTEATELAAHEPSLARDYVVRAPMCSGNAALALDRAADALDDASRARAALWAGITAPAEPNRITQVVVADLRSRALRDGNRTLDALPAYREELALAQKAGNKLWQALAWGQIADLQRLMRLYKDSEQSSLTGLALLGTDSLPRVRGDLLNNRAELAVLQGRPANAVPLFEASLIQRRTDPAIEPMPLATGERDLAAVLQTLGRNREAGRHMDIAIDGYRALGEKRIPYLVVALNRRATIAIAAGDPVRAESALRDLLALQDPASDDANTTRITLAALLDNQARREEASNLRDAALAGATARHGADSAAVVRIRVTQLTSLRASGRLAEAELGAWQCVDRAKGLHDLLLPCLMARAETALAAGADQQAADLGAKALVEAETHWTRDGGTVVQALFLQARVEAALGDADAVIRLYDRIHGLSADQGINRAWTDYGEGQLLTEAGETTIGPAMLRLALKQAKDAHNAGLAVAATLGLAGQLEKTGRWEEAMGLWQGVLPLLSDDAPANRIRVLEGMGTAATGEARYFDAARILGEAVSLCRTVTGVGSPDYGRLVLAWSLALMRSGAPDKAEDAIRLLDADPSPEARRLRTYGMMHLAAMADDPAAAVMLARSGVVEATAAYGADSVGVAFAQLDLIDEELAADRHIDDADLDDALRVIQAQNPSWAIAYRVAELRGQWAAQTGRLGDATTEFLRADVLATAHEGPGSLAAAIARSNRASVRLRAGEADEADQLFRQALAMAAPDGQWRNNVWARIAVGAVAAAERVGDIPRATRLRRDVDGLEPATKPRATVRWL